MTHYFKQILPEKKKTNVENFSRLVQMKGNSKFPMS